MSLTKAMRNEAHMRSEPYDPREFFPVVMQGTGKVDLGCPIRIRSVEDGLVYAFAAPFADIVRHVETSGPSPLAHHDDPNSHLGQWRLFAVHITEAMATAEPGHDKLVLMPYGVTAIPADATDWFSPRRAPMTAKVTRYRPAALA